MNVEDIGLGDTIRILSGKSRKDCLVVMIYYWNGIYMVCAIDAGDLTICQSDIDLWANAKICKYLPNPERFLGSKYSWIGSYNIFKVECIVKKADMQTVEASCYDAKVASMERPCSQCGRKNDIGVSECWHCLRANP